MGSLYDKQGNINNTAASFFPNGAAVLLQAENCNLNVIDILCQKMYNLFGT